LSKAKSGAALRAAPLLIYYVLLLCINVLFLQIVLGQFFCDRNIWGKLHKIALLPIIDKPEILIQTRPHR
jgi:hypothetical protein